MRMGFLYCFHYNHQTRLDEFWQLINPEVDEEVKVAVIIETLKVFIFVSVYLPFRIEELKGKSG